MSRYVSILGYGPSDSTMGECLITIPLIFCQTLSTSIVVFLSTPVWCSLPSPYGPSFHLSVIFIHHLCLVSSPHYWVSLFHTKTQIPYPNLRIHTQQSFLSTLPNLLAPNLRIHTHLLFPNLASLIREETFFTPQWVRLEVSVQRSFAVRGGVDV